MKLLIPFSVLLLAASGHLCDAAQPPRFNYQAKLSDSSGLPISGSHTFLFRLYQGGTSGGANSGAQVFEESAVLPVTDGVVNHTVGTGTGQTPGPLTSSMLKTDGAVYVQVAVDGTTILPRTRIDSVPYSILSADGDARVQISGTAPITISQPGSYYLTDNLKGVSGFDGIDITTQGVTLDLNGFSLTGVPGSLTAVSVNGSQLSNITIRNGVIRGWPGGGISSAANSAIQVSHLDLEANTGFGINAGKSSRIEDCIVIGHTLAPATGGITGTEDCVVARCTVTSNTSPAGQLVGIMLGAYCNVTECNCSGNTGAGDTFGIYVIQSCQISNCQCSSNKGGTTGAFFGTAGIHAGASCNIINCTCSGNVGAAGGWGGCGINGAAQCLISGCLCTDNTGSGDDALGGVGIIAGAAGCRILNNQCSNNSGSPSGSGTGIYSGAGGAELSGNECRVNFGSGSSKKGFGITCGGDSYIHDNSCTLNNGGPTGASIGIQLLGNNSRVENNHCSNQSGSLVSNYGIWLTDATGDGNALIKNTTSGNAGNGIRLDNTSSGANYYAENVVNDGIQNNGGSNVLGTGDRTNVSF